jgi:glutathione peroxidase-family protein
MHARLPETGSCRGRCRGNISNITSFSAVLRGCERFAETCCGAGWRRFGVKAREIKWNFTKFLVDRNGKAIARFELAVKLDSPDVIAAIEKALKQ